MLRVATTVFLLARGVTAFIVAARRPTRSASRLATKQLDDGKVSVAILGASGYTGAELVRLLIPHPNAKITVMTANSQAGQPMSAVFPQFAMLENSLPLLKEYSQISTEEWATVDCVFCCLPHAQTQEIVKGLPTHVRIVDLSADFRLEDPKLYEEWYGGAHGALDLQKEAVYGLTELYRDKIKGARLVANPGCYPTAAQLALIPLVEAKLIDAEGIIIDAKSGVTGAGRAAKQGSLYCEVADGMQAYGVASHRHAPEIEQGLKWALHGGGGGTSGKVYTPPIVNFTPHLIPMSRGILETMYVKLSGASGADELRAVLASRYANEPFVTVLPKGSLPQTRHVRGSNHCFMQVLDDRLKCRAIIISVIDNVVKGASGQAIQNMNAMYGFPETTGLGQLPLFP